jgi:cyclohexanecarboxylate-CoA ligase
MLDLVDRAGVTRLLATPNRLFSMIEAQLRRPRRLASLHTVASGGTPIPPSLVPAVQQVFGVRLRAVWGMTEVVVGTIVGLDDPPEWSARSDGRPLPGLEMDVLAPDGSGATGELRVRGASLCLGTMARDVGEITLTADLQDGWFATGDLARPDGRGGIRIVGRVADRVIGKNAHMIPVRDVEDELMRHPNVDDVAIISLGQGHLEEVCAVVVPAADQPPPTLAELNDHLHERGMTDWYRPARLELADALPRDHLGKIRKYQLRERFDPALTSERRQPARL